MTFDSDTAFLESSPSVPCRQFQSSSQDVENCCSGLFWLFKRLSVHGIEADMVLTSIITQ